jgi:hypothetical protein
LLPSFDFGADLRDLVGTQIESFDVRDGEKAFRNLGQFVLGHVDVLQVDEAFEVDWDVGQVALGVPHVQGPKFG